MRLISWTMNIAGHERMNDVNARNLWSKILMVAGGIYRLNAKTKPTAAVA